MRGRGRPVGSKNKPKNLTEYVITNVHPIPGPVMTRERSLEMNAIRTEKAAKGLCRVNGKVVGKPDGVKAGEFIYINAQARLDAKRIFKTMETDGLLPEDDLAKAALFTALVIIREPHPAREKLAAARLLLDFTKQKPATKTDVSINAAEAFLQALTDADGNG